MEKLNKNQKSVRGNVSLKAHGNLKKMRGELFSKGKDLTLEQTLEHILENLKFASK